MAEISNDNEITGCYISAREGTFTFAEPPIELVLESGTRLGPITVAYETCGELNAAGDNAILVLHALTGSAHAGGRRGPDDKIAGWWEPLYGSGKPFDPAKYFIISSNILGSCYGTTGPASINPATGKPYGTCFPVITVRDMVTVQKALLDHLGVKRLAAAVGGSLGGMQALEWGVMYPNFVDALIVIGACGRLYPQAIAFNEIGRRAIINDPAWQGGDYYPDRGPEAGLALARMVGTITYKSDVSMNRRFARKMIPETPTIFDLFSRFEVESYLYFHGDSLIKRFDANCYLYLTKVMDLHDIGRGRGSYSAAFGQIKARVLSIGISSDILFPTYQQQEIANLINKRGGKATYWELVSDHGHDAFLIEFEKMAPVMAKFINNSAP